MQEQKEMSQSELIKLKHQKKMETIARAISGMSRDTIAAGFVRLASDLVETNEELENFINQMRIIDKEIK